MSSKLKITLPQYTNLLTLLIDYSNGLDSFIGKPLNTIFVDVYLEEQEVVLVSDFDGKAVVLDSELIAEKVFFGPFLNTDICFSELVTILNNLVYDKRINFDVEFGVNERDLSVERKILNYIEQGRDIDIINAQKIRVQHDRYLECLER